MPSSLQIMPSQSESAPPSIQPSIACGPPIAAIMRGNVTNGPTPTMSIMFRPRAEKVVSPRSSWGLVAASSCDFIESLRDIGLPEEFVTLLL